MLNVYMSACHLMLNLVLQVMNKKLYDALLVNY